MAGNERSTVVPSDACSAVKSAPGLGLTKIRSAAKPAGGGGSPCADASGTTKIVVHKRASKSGHAEGLFSVIGWTVLNRDAQSIFIILSVLSCVLGSSVCFAVTSTHFWAWTDCPLSSATAPSI